MSYKGALTRSRSKKTENENEGLNENLDKPNASVSGKSIPNESKSHITSSSKSRSEDMLEIVEKLIQIQEEETSIAVEAAEAKASMEKAAADDRAAQLVAEAKRKELELKKRLLEDHLSAISNRSSRVSSRSSSRRSINLLPQPLSVKEAVENWMQSKDGADHADKNNGLESDVNVSVSGVKGMQQESFLPHLNEQSRFWPREDNDKDPRDAKIVSFQPDEGRKNPRDVSIFPRDMQPAPNSHQGNQHLFQKKVNMVDLPYEKKSRGKVLARVLSPLPSFSGDLEQWPAWIAEYRRSTDMNEYSDLENLQRLQKSLTGKAKDMISALLIYPENVPEIINLLERRFGRPEIIIKNLIANVRNRPPTKDYKPDTLVALSDMVRNLVVTVKSLKQDHYLFNPQLMEELTEKLSTNMKLNWGMFVTSPQNRLKLPIGIDSFSLWLSNMADAAAICAPSTSQPVTSYRNTSRNENYQQKNFVLVHDENDEKSSTKRMCICCKKQEHSLADCKQFLAFDVNKRWDLVKRCSVCFNCLKMKHRAAKCRRKIACGVNGCTNFHHSLLHNASKQEEDRKPNQDSTEVQMEHVGYQEESLARVLLRVLSVTLVGKNNKKIDTYALIDDGSTISIIEKGLADELEIEGPTSPLSFSWTDGTVYSEEHSKTVSITTLSDSGEYLTLNNVKTLTELQLPTQSMNAKQMRKKWPHLQSIPEEVFQRGRPRLLIGHEHIHFTVPKEVIIGPENAPVALKSKLGWTINGPTGSNYYRSRVDKDFVLFKSEVRDVEMEELNSLVKKSFERDFVDSPVESCKKSEEDIRAENILEKTCSQTHDGRWQVGLLWKEDHPQLTESRSVAWRRLNYVDKKMKENTKLNEQYHEQIASYLEKGYAKKLNFKEMKTKSKRTWYLPHFAVKNPMKPDKFRFVFDAASKSYGESLNDKLLPGPNLFNSLIKILFQFRKHKIAYASDIEEMFLRIKVIPEDQDALRFLWHEKDSMIVEEWCMTSMIFGAVCSPTSAIYVTRKNAETYGEGRQEAVIAVKEQFYMDDYLDSRQTVEEAMSLVKEVKSICAKGNFNLRNFVSNSSELMNSLPKPSWSKSYLMPDIGVTKEDNTERVLGLHWDFHDDLFLFKVKFTKLKKEIVELTELPTKRQVLQAVMSVYDPVGFITPITMKGKILLQNLWKLKVQWDDKIPEQLEKSWKNWMKDVKYSEKLRIPRCYSLTSTSCLQLHIFCDASEKGFCAVAYFRTENQGHVELAFVLARSRVAPLKPSTIPRLELQAAVLGCRIATLIHQFHKLDNVGTYFWTDSRIVWCWLQASHKQKSVYIANRVKEILNNTERNQWRWLPTTENVADEATRDSTINFSNDKCRWLQGPDFLRKPDWHDIGNLPKDDEIKEVVLSTSPMTDEKPLINMERFSKYSRLVRTIAWVQRFIFNGRNKTAKNVSPSLSVEELMKAEDTCFKLSQLESFPKEVKNLREGKSVHRESRILKLSPILVGGILKMRGRTEYGNQVSQEVKTPVILDPKQRLTILLIQNEHELAAHQGQETVANNLRQRFWILRLKQSIKSCWANCKKCQLRHATPKIPEMAPLPSYRLQPYGRPFSCVALDYFGPLEVTVGRRREKRYGALFTCLSVRAIHLELATSLNTDSAILAIRRFSSRRGQPTELISDNGTNFRGAEKELREALQTFDQEQLKTFCAEKKTKWSFLPPASPHMGGAHERLVQSVKKCLYVVLKSQAPREETLSTLLCEVEYIINNRPLTFVSEDPSDELPLTPNHFLLGGADKLVPAIAIKEKHLRRQWKIAQDYADKFWKRWMREYVPQLNKRTKWHNKQENIEVGSLVLVADDNQPRGSWFKGVVEAVYPGRDGQVRVADVRTVTGVWRRPAAKLVKLMK